MRETRPLRSMWRGAGNEMMGAGLRATAKAVEHPPEPKVGAPVLDPTAPVHGSSDGHPTGVDAAVEAAAELPVYLRRHRPDVVVSTTLFRGLRRRARRSVGIDGDPASRQFVDDELGAGVALARK